MANDTVSDSVMFPSCKKILRERISPIHYRELTLTALVELGIDSSHINMFRQMEDVRERLPSNNGVKYIKTPHCLMYLSEWVAKSILFNNIDPILLNANINDSFNACYEGLMRSPYMLNKGNIPMEIRAKARARGLITEQHVVGWFREKWQCFFEEPDNKTQWQKPCSHDFKLRLENSVILVDVTGDNNRHEFYKPPGKRTTDLHVFAGMDDTDNNIVIYGFRKGEDFTGKVIPDTTQPIQRLIFYLNVKAAGLDYNLFT